MASEFISEPGTERGPCVKCRHTDCAALRKLAGGECRYCAEPIGYDVRFYRLPSDPRRPRLVHAVCEEETAG